MIRRPLLLGVAVVLALVIFAIDYWSPLDGAVAVLQTAVILLVAPLGRRFVVGAGLSAGTLAIVAFFGGHMHSMSEGALSRLGVSLVAILITTLLSLRDRSTRTTLGEQARILELSHDTVVIRDRGDVILYWNDGAEHLYGWPRVEALGKRCNELLQSSFAAAEVDAAMEREGHWSGEVTRTRRDGSRVVLASRWLLRRDPEGRPVGIIESSADLTEARRADAERRSSEQRFRTIFESAGFATWESDWSETLRIATEDVPDGQPIEPWLVARASLTQAAMAAAVIRQVNQAAVELFDAEAAGQLVGSSMCERYLPEAMPAVAQILAALAGGADEAESEMRLLTLGGRVIDVVVRVNVLPESHEGSHMLVTAYDVTERNEARARIEQTSAELAHAARVSMLGQLAASIAHEVNQPLTAIVNYGKSAKRWLSRDEPDLGELDLCLDRIVSNSTRAADVIGRVRGLARKAAPQTEPLDLIELSEEAMALVQREARAAGVTMRRLNGEAPPLAAGDRVQVQQVLVNLLMNGIQAMRDVRGGRRELSVAIGEADAMLRVAVEDSGTGFAGDGAQRIFEPFFTTKEDGMGMGLSICRSIIEAQGGRIMASNNDGEGATVAFTLPLATAEPHALAQPPSLI
ncbi:ATP-binding protein [Sphingomonas sp.]|uniref:PAS domain-containing sensor histidine kinase n=1 Tax=Sphingomonas sp. TaxID=28214 RepID=UPI001B25CB9B|nr:ATP-binding protein [Sphingomonas sp.]MBO9712387.1 PAS domain S-box protein [Sphingomonas sp.]